jgi:hypothetical protein
MIDNNTFTGLNLTICHLQLLLELFNVHSLQWFERRPGLHRIPYISCHSTHHAQRIEILEHPLEELPLYIKPICIRFFNS